MNCIKNGKYTGDSCFGCSVKAMDCEIRDKVYRNRWIPVSERLPEANKKVICLVSYYGHLEIKVGHYTNTKKGGRKFMGNAELLTYSKNTWGESKDIRVIAWIETPMMPEPYQGGSQDDIK